MNGRIIKGVGSFYEIMDAQGLRKTFKACGRFRSDKITPLPGDLVETENGFIISILPRKNALTRPYVANIDMLVIVVALSEPPPDFLLLDKLLLQAELMHIEPLIIFNKLDDVVAADTLSIKNEYRAYTTLFASAKTREGIDLVKNAIKGKLACMAGQSAVGKTSLLNAIVPEQSMAVGSLSLKSGRGKHTTRHAELLVIDPETILVDTPGFSFFELETLPPMELALLYPEFRSLNAYCRFTSCLHEAEPDCAVKNDPSIPQGRYARYITLLKHLKVEYKNRYD